MQLLQLSILFAASQDHKLWSAGQEEEGEYGDLDALYIFKKNNIIHIHIIIIDAL